MKTFGLVGILNFVLNKLVFAWLDPAPQCDRCGRDANTLYPFRVTENIVEMICGGCMRRRRA